jgi:DNA-binding NarL/FixJ family response regulator
MDAGAVTMSATPTTAVTIASVLVVEDDALIAQVVMLALRAAGYQAEVCEARDETSIVDHVRSSAPRVVLLDLLHSGCGGSAPALVASLRALGAEVVAFTDTTDRLLQGAVVEAGASDIVSRLAPVQELLEAVAGALRGESRLGVSYRLAMLQQLHRDRAERQARLAPFERLTRREAAVLGHMMEGDSAEHIATACYVSLPTVRSQIRAILTKLGVNSQLAAVAMAYRAGWSAPLDASR